MSIEQPELDPPILQGLAQAVPQIDPSLALRSRVLGSVARERRSSSDSARGKARPLLAGLAIAASLALATGLTLYTAHLRDRISALESDLQEASRRADASGQEVADARRAAAGAQSAVAVLTAPDVARIDLAGQPAAPNASARAFWSRSRGLVFAGMNLPVLPAGRTYQLWVVTAQTPISAGLLRPDAQGGISGTFATPPDMPAPVAMAVTIEPDGGMPAPTGEKYLVGTL